jgi:uncharacterized membrane protein
MLLTWGRAVDSATTQDVNVFIIHTAAINNGLKLLVQRRTGKLQFQHLNESLLDGLSARVGFGASLTTASETQSSQSGFFYFNPSSKLVMRTNHGSYKNIAGAENETRGFQMILRSGRERLLQTLFYEIGGLLIILPIYAMFTGHAMSESLVLLVAVSIATMTWACAHNIGFDYIEARLTGRVASDRPQLLRLVHAASTEITSILVTTPVIVLVSGYGWWQALMTDIGLTLFYAAYAYAFHLSFDALRPVKLVSRSTQAKIIS